MMPRPVHLPGPKGGEEESMIEIPMQYQAVFFGDMSDITPSPAAIRAMLDLFQDIGLLPSLIMEWPSNQARLQLKTIDNELDIRLHSDRIAIDLNSTKPKGENLGTLEGFAKRAADLLGKILSKFPKKAHRLSLVSTGLGRQISDENMKSIYVKLFNPLDFYVEHDPVEWSVRSVARVPGTFAGLAEQLNVITRISRITVQTAQLMAQAPDVGQLMAEAPETGQLMAKPEDANPTVATSSNRLKFVFDINTFQGNVEQRFDKDAVAEFCQKALCLRTTLLSQVEGRISGL